MKIIEFAKKEQIKNFIEGLVHQAGRNYSPETIEAVEERFFAMFALAEDMDEDAADTYLTHCLGIYMLESYETSDMWITKIEPRED
jgi:hypothetical protein